MSDLHLASLTPEPHPTEVTVTGTAVLLTISGQDRPGVSRTFFSAMDALPILVLDVEQVVTSGQLILASLMVPDPVSHESLTDITTTLDAIESTAATVVAGLGLSLNHERRPVEEGAAVPAQTHVTVLGSPLRPGALAAIARTVAECNGNIENIERLAAYPVTAIELHVSGADQQVLRRRLAAEAASSSIDVAVQPAGLHRRAKRLVVMDVDSTLIQGEVIEMLAKFAGCEPQVAAITESAMRGEIDFAESLRRRVNLLAGLDAGVLDAVASAVVLTPGARTLIRTLRRLGYQCGIVSGGFDFVTDHLAAELELDFALANRLEVRYGVLTGEVLEPVVDRAAKAQALRDFAGSAGVPLAQTVAIGDGANDLDMLQTAGLGIAFNAKPLVQKAADTSVNVPYLDTILFLLGISRAEIEVADGEG
ncbi:MAG: phosphoserine phosphatase SerB [Actinomycetia bacterium]|nr:phosphoserine phosphatase SerB [Actinomycetes bacterium]